MATATNLTVKKYDNVTDVTYTVISGAPGDKLPAIWRNEAFNAIAGNRPVLEFASKRTQNGTNARVCELKLQFPELFTNSTTGITAVRMKDVASAAITINVDAADTTHQEAVAQFLNLCLALKASIISGYAPV